jgi:hypothetical protein
MSATRPSVKELPPAVEVEVEDGRNVRGTGTTDGKI